jgi:hypothetical protein
MGAWSKLNIPVIKTPIYGFMVKTGVSVFIDNVILVSNK